MTGVDGHVLFGGSRRYDDSIDADFVALLHDAAVPRWRVENLLPENELPRRTVVTTPRELLVFGLAVAMSAAVDNVLLTALVEPDEGRLDIDVWDEELRRNVDRSLREHRLSVSAVVFGTPSSALQLDHAEELLDYVVGDVTAAATVWSQIGENHSGFGAPGSRWTNPDWAGQES